jgi:hypothetical protein
MEDRYEKAQALNEEMFKRLFGVKRETFEKAREILQNQEVIDKVCWCIKRSHN